MNTTTITKEITISQTFKINIPSFYQTKTGWQTYRIYEVDGETRCDAVHDWGDKKEFISNYPLGAMNLKESYEIPAQQYLAKLDLVIQVIENTLNEIKPKQDDEIWLLRQELNECPK